MASMAQQALPPAVLSGFKEAIGCLVLGTVLSACIYGVSILQAYLYFPNSRQDSLSMRSFVALIFTLDSVSMFLTVVTLYDFVVTDFGDPLRLLNVPPSLAVLNAFTFLIATLAQCFFAHRLWSLMTLMHPGGVSGGNKLLVGTIVFGALGAFGIGVALSVYMYYHREIASLASPEIRILGGIESGMSVICDIVIVVGLCYYLNSKRTGFKRTDSIIDRLIIYAINRGVLTAVCQVAHMISIIGLPKHFTSIVFGLMESKLYCNALFATLNAQRSLREESDNDDVEIVSRIVNRVIPPTPAGVEHSRSAAGQLKVPDTPCSESDTMASFVVDISNRNTTKPKHPDLA